MEPSFGFGIDKLRKDYYLSASIISGKPCNLKEDLHEINLANMDFIHFDMMDGDYVPRFGLHPEYLVDIKKHSSIPVEAHLMLTRPDAYIPLLVESGADIIIPHIEPLLHANKTINLINDMGITAGIALNIATPLSNVEYVLEDVKFVTLMAINPGIKGHEIINTIFRKVTELKTMIKNKGLEVLIQVDGGVNIETAPKLINAGADILVCGASAIFNQNVSLSTKCKELRKRVEQIV